MLTRELCEAEEEVDIQRLRLTVQNVEVIESLDEIKYSAFLRQQLVCSETLQALSSFRSTDYLFQEQKDVRTKIFADDFLEHIVPALCAWHLLKLCQCLLVV